MFEISRLANILTYLLLTHLFYKIIYLSKTDSYHSWNIRRILVRIAREILNRRNSGEYNEHNLSTGSGAEADGVLT